MQVPFVPECLGVQPPGPPTEPRNLEPQKCILRSEKCRFGPLGKMAPNKIKMSQNGNFLDI